MATCDALPRARLCARMFAKEILLLGSWKRRMRIRGSDQTKLERVVSRLLLQLETELECRAAVLLLDMSLVLA